ncbi:MAG TPA: polysaccharide deacetylase family protein [Firmicutes bacterium]|nr:polysaccharide deacetylase family protein [Bacillota bacterium]
MTGFYQAFLFTVAAGFLIGALPWLEVARALRARLRWKERLGAIPLPPSEHRVALWLLAGEFCQGVIVALLALAVTGSAVGVVLGGLAAIAGSQLPVFGRLQRLPFHHLQLGPFTVRLDRTLILATGLLAVMLPEAALMLGLLWGVALVFTRYSPISAVLTALSLPVLLWRVTGYDLWALFGGATAIIAIYQEIPYLLRTRRGQEPSLLASDLQLPRTPVPYRQSRRTTLAARAAFLGMAAVVLTAVALNRYVYQGFGPQMDIFRRGNPDLPYVALTFDDGPDPRYTPEVLRILAQEDVPATFFLVGAHAARYPELVRRIQREGHEIGSHTYSHRNLFLLKPAAIAQEVERAEEVLLRLTGERPHLFRPPRGLFDANLRRILAERRYTTVLWSVSSRDWVEASPRLIARNVLGPVRGGDILLFHDSGAIISAQGGDRRHMLQALPYIIQRLKAEGFRFVTVSQLLVISGLTSEREPPL